jgi:hypothetical protein
MREQGDRLLFDGTGGMREVVSTEALPRAWMSVPRFAV